MDMNEHFRDPLTAAIFAGIITIAYLHLKAKMNNEDTLQMSAYVKPAILNAILVFFIVFNGIGMKETISTKPF